MYVYQGDVVICGHEEREQLRHLSCNDSSVGSLSSVSIAHSTDLAMFSGLVTDRRSNQAFVPSVGSRLTGFQFIGPELVFRKPTLNYI